MISHPKQTADDRQSVYNSAHQAAFTRRFARRTALLDKTHRILALAYR